MLFAAIGTNPASVAMCRSLVQVFQRGRSFAWRNLIDLVAQLTCRKPRRSSGQMFKWFSERQARLSNYTIFFMHVTSSTRAALDSVKVSDEGPTGTSAIPPADLDDQTTATGDQYRALLAVSKAILSHRDLSVLFHDLASQLHQ